MWTRLFWSRALERALKTFAQTLAGLMGAGGLGVLDADWVAMLSVSAMAALASLLTSVAGSQSGDPQDPSLLPPPAPEGMDPRGGDVTHSVDNV